MARVFLHLCGVGAGVLQGFTLGSASPWKLQTVWDSVTMSLRPVWMRVLVRAPGLWDHTGPGHLRPRGVLNPRGPQLLQLDPLISLTVCLTEGTLNTRGRCEVHYHFHFFFFLRIFTVFRIQLT